MDGLAFFNVKGTHADSTFYLNPMVDTFVPSVYIVYIQTVNALLINYELIQF